jgi:hypothetical protein
MATLQFQPHVPATGARARGCYTCAHFHGRLMAQHVVCEQGGGIQVIGTPKNGCAYWEREPGADDE